MKPYWLKYGEFRRTFCSRNLEKSARMLLCKRSYVTGDDPRHQVMLDYARDIIYPRHKKADADSDFFQAEEGLLERYDYEIKG